jgi:DNA-binding transcriptional LysR family regulator
MLLREIEVFRAVMTAGTASKAAQVLGVTQSAVSQALVRLERQAAMPLFDRARGRLRPTSAAEALLSEVNRCFVGLEAIEHRLRSLAKFEASRVRIAALPGMGMGFLPRVLRDMELAERQQTVSLQIMPSADVRGLLLEKGCDLGLMAEDASSAGLETSLFARYEGVVALPVNHPLASRRVVRPVDLARFPMISLNPEDAASQRLNAIFRQHGVVPKILVETPYTVSICELIQQGVGIGVVNSITAADFVGRGVALRRFSESLPYSVTLAMPPGQTMTEFASRLLSKARIRLEAELQKLRQLLA